MNKIYISDTAKFEEVINNIEAILPSISNTFQSEKRNSEGMNGEGNTWKGQSQEKLYEKYKILESNFGPIEEALHIYVKFLRKTLEDYKALENSLNAKIDEYASNQMDVNS